ncbi:hypothetical protein NDU88_003022, partial [Pleurodeles waltl]
TTTCIYKGRFKMPKRPEPKKRKNTTCLKLRVRWDIVQRMCSKRKEMLVRRLS